MFNRIILRAINGKQKGEEFVLENETAYILGRSQDCSFVLNDPLRLVSRRHCRIDVQAPSVRLRDLGSRNGTKVNGKFVGRPVKQDPFENCPQVADEECLLENGDTLHIAGYEFQVTFDPIPPCAAAEPRDQNKLWSCPCGAY